MTPDPTQTMRDIDGEVRAYCQAVTDGQFLEGASFEVLMQVDQRLTNALVALHKAREAVQIESFRREPYLPSFLVG